MRELKFRVWDIDKQEYITCFDMSNEGCVWTQEPCCSPDYPNVIIEQYTGLKDKHGKEIYEGDIVEALIDGMWSTGRSTVSFGKAKWRLEALYNDIRFMDVFRVIGSKNCPDRIYYLFDKELSDIEVIGNIHENPELLEGRE